MTKAMTGAKMVVQALKDQGVEVVFGYPGGAVLPIYDEIFLQNDIRHILVRHEQGAIHMAEGYARSTGKPGCALVTSGPGATNAVTGLTDALMDSIPLVVFSGQVPTFMIGTDGFQEADTVGITRPCTKHNWLVKDADKLAEVIHQAFHVATSGRPGPVLIDLPKDVQFATGTYTGPKQARTENYQPKVKGDIEAITKLVELMETAERPIFYTGGGVINSGTGASQLLRELVDATGFPITSTLMGLGAYPASGKNWLGMLGMHGLYEANLAMHGCDLMIAVGARFDDRITGRVSDFSPRSTKAQIDIDASEFGRTGVNGIALWSDAAEGLDDLAQACLPTPETLRARQGRIDGSHVLLSQWRASAAQRIDSEASPINVARLLRAVNEVLPEDGILIADGGFAAHWSGLFFDTKKAARQFVANRGFASIGYGLPAALGAQLAAGSRRVISLTGDGGLNMSLGELETARRMGVPLILVVLNNAASGYVKAMQHVMFGPGNYQSSELSEIDYAALAEAVGCFGLRVERPDLLESALRMALAQTDRPTLVDVVVTRDPAQMLPGIDERGMAMKAGDRPI